MKHPFLSRYWLISFFLSFVVFFGQTQDYQTFKNEENALDKFFFARDLFTRYLTTDLDSVKLLGDELLTFSNKERFRDGIYLAFHILGDYFIESAQEEKGIRLLMEAKNYYFEQQDFESMMHVYNAIGTAYHRLESYQKAISYYKIALSYGEVADNQNMAKIALLNWAKALQNLEEYTQAVEKAQEFKRWAIQTHQNTFIANAFSVIGSIFLDLSDYQQAIDNFEKSYQYAEQQNDHATKANALTNMGIVFFLQDELAESQRCFFTALEARKQLQAITSLCDAYLNCGGILFEQGQTKQAAELYLEGYTIANQHKKYTQEIELLEALLELYHKKSPAYQEVEEKLLFSRIQNEFKNEAQEQQNEITDQELIRSIEARQGRGKIKKKYTWVFICAVAGIILIQMRFSINNNYKIQQLRNRT